MIKKVEIVDNERTPIPYLSELEAFRNGRVFEFTKGVNIIIGENGSGKSSLMNLIESYLLVGSRECSIGRFNKNINKLYKNFLKKDDLLDGANVFADYQLNTFRLLHKDEKDEDDIYADMGTHLDQLKSSTGEGVSIALASMFNYVFNKKPNLTFNYLQLKDSHPLYVRYISDHIVEPSEWTFLMDEPDRNLSIDKIMELKKIFGFHKEKTQIIAVIHNPLLIYALSKKKSVHFIELTDGYLDKVKTAVTKLVK